MKPLRRNLYAACLVMLGMSCDNYLTLDVPYDQLAPASVFTDDALAEGAVAGIYQEMANGATSHFASGGINSITALMDIAAGSLVLNVPDANTEAFSDQLWLPDNSRVYTLWSSAYKTIFRANEVLEGLERYGGVKPALASQLRAESLFIRAFTHTQLVMLFGGVPLALTADYRTTQHLPRSTPEAVFAQAETDLLEAMEILPTDYSHAQGERVRPNRWAAALLLARLYTYQQRWADALAMADVVIDQSDRYHLVPIAAVYLKNNEEAIWQLLVLDNAQATNEGRYGLPVAGLANPPRYSYAAEVLDVLTEIDARKANWIGYYTMPNGTDVYSYVHKYKIQHSPDGERPNEYGMILRLTEAYLIRAEARLRQGDVNGALADVNAIREAHGGLGPLTIGDADAVMDAIERERLIEFTYEWGHRWADLKRWGRNDLLLPIPQRELEANPFLTPNPDYRSNE